jgi:hypothetical protein
VFARAVHGRGEDGPLAGDGGDVDYGAGALVAGEVGDCDLREADGVDEVYV